MKPNNEPYWSATTPKTLFPQLNKDAETDVLIIGAGITGMTAAILLKHAGKKVVVIDQHTVSDGETGHTTAHTTEIVDTRYYQLTSDFGLDGAKMVAESSRQSIDQIEALTRQYQIDCQFQRVPAYLYADRTLDLYELKREYEGLKKVGVQCERVDQVPLPFQTMGGILVPNQAQFHPRRYLLGLAQAFSGHGCHIFQNTHAIEIEDGEPCTVTTGGGKIRAKSVFVATNHPALNRIKMHTKIAPYRTYALAVYLKGKIPPPGLYWDLQDPYHYTRMQEDVWIIGGEDHKTGTKENTEESFQSLKEYVESHFQVQRHAHRWSGQIIEPVDGLPFIGLNPGAGHTFIATGYAGNGMTFGTVAGMLVADLIQGKKNPWAELYKASRKKIKASAKDFLKENAEVGLCFFKDRLVRGEVNSVQEIKPGEGKRVKMGMETAAVYRDEHGKLHSVSAVCTHMACHVHFNQAERSWDCPCHGSRFSPDGKVLNGPATHPLKKLPLGKFQEDKKKKSA